MDTTRTNWVKIQQKTFTNWINEELKGTTPKYEVKDIQTGFQDGIVLLALLRKLHSKSIHSSTSEEKGADYTVQALVPVHENPQNESEMCENLDKCLHFMKEQKFCGIKSTDINNGKLNVILGLVYSLIYRYHIQKKLQESPNQISTALSKSVNVRAIIALLSWINWQIHQRFPSMKKIRNLNTDWNDGIALCALIESIEEGTCPESPKLDNVRNCEKGLDLGSKWPFKIPKIISAEHLANPDIDETSVMVYLCYYLQYCFKKSPEPIHQDGHEDQPYIDQVPPEIVKFLDEVGLVAIPFIKKDMFSNVKIPTAPDATRCIADLDFFEQSIFTVGQTIVFAVDCAYAGKGKFKITCTTDTNEQVETWADQEPRKRSNKVFYCFLRVEAVGIHEVNIQWGAPEKDNYDDIIYSPKRFIVCNPEAVEFDTHSRHNVYVGDTIKLGVDTSKAGHVDMLHAEFSDAKMSYEMVKSDSKVTFIYTADETHKGPSELSLFFNGIKIKKKVFEITVVSDYLKTNPKMEARVTVFINYINYILKTSSGEEVSDFQWDFQSGVTLAFLLKTLSGQEIRNLNAKPQNKLEMMQNLKACFTFMQSLKLELHGTKEEHIYNGDGEAILKVLWEIIKFYHICNCNIRVSVENTMLMWFQAVLSTTAVNNFVTDWCDGILFCRLIEMLEPGLCPQYSVLQTSSAREKCEFAITCAKNNFGIPSIISTDMLQKGNLDKKCMMIYLAFFIQHAKILLLAWLQEILPDRNINNLTTDWCDGENLIALCNTLCLRVHSTWHTLDSHSTKDNFSNVMKASEENLGIGYSQMFSPELFSEAEIDEFRSSAYLFYFRYAFERVDASKCKPSFENQQRVNFGDPIKFNIEYNGTSTGEVTQYGQDPRSDKLSLKDPQKDNQTYCIESFPTKVVGDYKIAVYWNKTAIPGSPFTIYVCDPKLVVVKIHPVEMTLGEVIFFEIDAIQAGNGIVAAKVIDPGSTKEDVIFTKICKHEVVKEWYIPPVVGTIEFLFTFNGVTVNQQKCTVLPGIVTTTNKFTEYCRIRHKYLNNDHLLVNPPAAVQFSVDVTNAGTGSLTTTVTVDGKQSDDIQVHSSIDKSKGAKYRFSFIPQKPLKHIVTVKWNDHEIPGSPFEVNVIERSKCKPNKNDLPIKPMIDGKYSKAILNKEIKFKVDSSGAGNSTLHSIISQPGHKSISLTPVSISKTGEYTFVYKPCEVGRFDIILRYSKTHIRTYKCYTVPNITSDTGIIVLPSHFALIFEPFEFYMKGGPSYTAIVYDPQNEKITPKKKSSYLASFTPKLTGSYVMFEVDNGQCVPNSSSVIQCINPRECKLLENMPKYLQVGEVTVVKVTTAGAGLGILSVLINGREDDQMCTAIVNSQQDDCLHCVTLKPKLVGSMCIQVLFAGMPISNFGEPLKVQVCDAKKCITVMKTNNCLVGNSFSFTLDTAGAGSGKAISKAYNSNNQQVTVDIIKSKNGPLQCTFTPVETSEYLIDVIWGAAHVPGSPFKVVVEKPTGVLCLAIGSGLNKGIADKPAKFYITAESGLLESKGLFVSIRAINHTYKVNKQIEETSAGHYDVEYTAPTVGEYVAEIKRYGREIVFSPFKIDIIQGANASKCEMSEINPIQYKYTNTPLKFYVDTSKGGNGVLSVVVKDPYNKKLNVYIKQGKNGQFSVRFIAENEGIHSISVLWSNDHVPGSPLDLQVHKLEDASKVYAHGQGLQNGRLGKFAEFIVETKDSGQGKLTIYGLSAEGLFEVHTVHEPGTCKASYQPSCIGDVYINIKWGRNQNHIPGSPFRVSITSSDPLPLESISKSDFQVQGLPLESEIAYLNTDITYTVSTRSVLQGKVESRIARPGQRSIILTPVNDEGTTFQYRPCEVGRFFIILRYSIIPVCMSPYACIAIDNSNIKSTEIGVISMPNRIALLNKTYTFYIQGNPAYTAVVYDPKNSKVNIFKKPHSPVANFVPDCTGSYVVFEEQNRQLIPNSFFVLQCIDPSKCKVLGDLPSYLQVGKAEEFIVTSADSGLGALSVFINDEEDNPLCTAIVNTNQDSRHHKVTLKPRFVGDVSIKLLFVGLTIPQFEEPFKVHICDASKCEVVMPNNVCIFGEKFTFTLISSGAGFGKANFEVYHPDHQLGRNAVSIIDNRDGSFQCTYTPVDIGEHMIDVIWGVDHVKGCPFKIMVEKPAGNLCLAIGSGLNRATVGKPAKFYITAVNSSLNRNDLVISITEDKHECKVDIDETSNKHYDVVYTAPKVGEYKAIIKYCNEDIIFSPFTINAVQGADASKCNITGINSQGVYAKDLIEFNVDTSQGGDGTLRVVVTDQNDKQLAVFIKKENNEQHHIAFIPGNEGTHTVSILWSEFHVPQSPLKLHIHQSVAAEKVYAYGQGLRSGTVGKLANFTVVTKHAGKVVPTINGFSSDGAFVVDIKEKGIGTYEASYMPSNIEEISINIKWCDTPIPGSPFKVRITSNLTHNTQPVPVHTIDTTKHDIAASEQINNDFELKGIPLRNNIAYLNTEVSYTVNITNRDVRHGALQSFISFPNHKTGTLLPIKQKNGEYKFHFFPSKVGTFEIAVCYSNIHLHESPYKCTAIDKDATSGVIYISNNVAQVGVPYEFYIQGGHSYSAIVYHPQNERVRNVECVKEKYSTIARFTPQLTGSYAIFEEINGQQISKNSYTLNCVDPNKCEILGDLSKFLQVGRAARFKVISRDAGPGDITVQFGDEENNQICHKIVEKSHYVHTVTLKPTQVGSISIKVAFSGISIPKTPLKVEICDAYQCRVLGDLTGQYQAGTKIAFRLLTAGAGCGKAVIKVRGPTNHEYINTIEIEKNVLECAFIPKELGNHSIDVMWGIEHILGSPFDFTVLKSNKVVCIAGLEERAIAHVPAKFTIQANEDGLLDNGSLSVSIKQAPSNYEAQVKSKDVGNGIYDITYIAPESGSYTVEIKHCDQNITIPGTSFRKITVSDADVSDTAEKDASKCQVTKIRSEDVHYTNTSLEFFIDTTQLVVNYTPDVTIRDPNDQQVIDMFTHKSDGGYAIKFIPDIKGIYTIIVLISGYHVQGSPFKIRCMTTNANLVKAEGDGLSHGILGEWAEFTVDTEDAGQGVPTITALSNEGPFDIEKYLEHEGSSKYIARYNPQIAGEIFITIKWSGVDIPNSPFKVVISDHSGYEPMAASQMPTALIVNNPAFDPSNVGPYIDEDYVPEDTSSPADSDVVSDSDTDSDDDASSITDHLLHYHPTRRPTQKKSDTTVVMIGDERKFQTTVIQQPRDTVSHYLHFFITIIFPPWLIVWVILCCIHGC